MNIDTLEQLLTVYDNADNGDPDSIYLIENKITFDDYKHIIKNPYQIIESSSKYGRYLKAVVLYLFYNEKYDEILSICNRLSLSSTNNRSASMTVVGIPSSNFLAGVIFNDELYYGYNQRKAISLFKKSGTKLGLLELGKIYKYDDLSKATYYFNQVDDENGRYELGLLYLLYNNERQAIEQFLIKPQKNLSHFELGKIYQRQGLIEKAIHEYNDSNISEGYIQIANIYLTGEGDVQKNNNMAISYLLNAGDDESIEKVIELYADQYSRTYDLQKAIYYMDKLKQYYRIYELTNDVKYLQMHLLNSKTMDQEMLSTLINHYLNLYYRSTDVETVLSSMTMLKELYPYVDNPSDQLSEIVNIDINDVVSELGIEREIADEIMNEVIDEIYSEMVDDMKPKPIQKVEIENIDDIVYRDLPKNLDIEQPPYKQPSVEETLQLVKNVVTGANKGNPEDIEYLENYLDIVTYYTDYNKILEDYQLRDFSNSLEKIAEKAGGYYGNYLLAMTYIIQSKFNKALTKMKKLKGDLKKYVEGIYYRSKANPSNDIHKSYQIMEKLNTLLARTTILDYISSKPDVTPEEEEQIINLAEEINTSHAYVRMAHYYQDNNNDFETALHYYKLANDVKYYGTMATLYYSMKDYDEAFYYYYYFRPHANSVSYCKCDIALLYFDPDSPYYNIEIALRLLNECLCGDVNYLKGMYYSGAYDATVYEPKKALDYLTKYIKINTNQDIKYDNAKIRIAYINIQNALSDRDATYETIATKIATALYTMDIDELKSSYPKIGKYFDTLLLIRRLRGDEAFVKTMISKIEQIGQMDLHKTD